MDPDVIALASALSRLNPISEVDSKVLDGGISQTPKNLLSR